MPLLKYMLTGFLFTIYFSPFLIAQKLDWAYSYKGISRAYKIDRISDQRFIISGHLNDYLLYCGLFDQHGNHLKTYSFENNYQNRGYSNSTAFHGTLPNGQIAVLLYDGRLMKINPDNLEIDSSLANIQNYFWQPVTIYQAYLRQDTLCVFGYNSDVEALYFEYSFYNNSYSNIKGNLQYPFNSISGLFFDHSMYALKKENGLFFEHFKSPVDKPMVSIRIDTFFKTFQKAILSNRNEYYLMGDAVDSTIYGVICKFDSTGQMKWRKTFRPEKPTRGSRPFKIFTDLKESSDSDILIVGTEGSYITGPISNSIIIKLSTSGDVLWEDKKAFLYEGNSNNELTLDSAGNYYVTGTAGLSDYSIPNRAYIAKYSNEIVQNKHVDVNSKFSIYPNPATDFITINLPNHFDFNKSFVEFYNFQGQLIYKSILNQLTESIPLNFIKDKILLARLSSNGKSVYFQKIILE